MESHSLQIVRLVVGQMQENCYLVIYENSKEALIVDPGDDAEYIIEHIEKLGVTPTKIIATHGHFDHIMAAYALQLAYKIPFFINDRDIFLVKNMADSAKYFLGLKYVDPAPKITGQLDANETIDIGKTKLQIIETPGHTPGSVSFYIRESHTVIVGDVLFEGGQVGRTDFSYSNQSDLNSSIKKVLSLPGDTIIYSGHGRQTSVESEQKNL